MPRATIPLAPLDLDAQAARCSAGELRACSPSAVGVRSLAGGSAGRAHGWPPRRRAPPRATARSSSPVPETSRRSRCAGGASPRAGADACGARSGSRARIVPSTRPPATASGSAPSGSSQQSVARRRARARARTRPRRPRARAPGSKLLARAEPDERASAGRRRGRAASALSVRARLARGEQRAAPRRARPAGRPRPRRRRPRPCRRRCRRRSAWSWRRASGGTISAARPSRRRPGASHMRRAAAGAACAGARCAHRRRARSAAAVDYHSRSRVPVAQTKERPALMPKTVILGAARTPIGKMGGGLATLDATELGAVAIEAALERAGVEPEQVDHVVMGQVLQAGQGQIPSRQAQIKAGIPKEVSSETINKVCASGLRAVGDPRPGDPRRRPRGRRRRRHGVDVEGALPAAAGALRLPHGRRQDARRDGPRRARRTRSRASRCSSRRPRSATSSR